MDTCQGAANSDDINRGILAAYQTEKMVNDNESVISGEVRDRARELIRSLREKMKPQASKVELDECITDLQEINEEIAREIAAASAASHGSDGRGARTGSATTEPRPQAPESKPDDVIDADFKVVDDKGNP